MGKYFRILIVIALVAGIGLLASNRVAWAGRGAEQSQAVQSVGQSAPALAKPEPGSVKPPPAKLTACQDGIHSLGGISTLEITDLAPGYCLAADLWNRAFAVGRIPDGAGKILADITFLRVFYHGELVHDLPVEDGQVQICYAVPPGKTAQIYFFDFYGPRFGEQTGQPAWEPLATTVEGGIACAAAQTTGAYALIGE